jgi:short chain dehydrogenase.
MKDRELTGKNAVITGASKGLGKSIALALAENGATSH